MTAPTVSGESREGATPTRGQGTWSGRPTSYAHRWARWARWATIVGGATGPTYVTRAADLAERLRCAV